MTVYNFLIIGLTIVSIPISKRVYMNFFNPCSCMNFIWCIVTSGSRIAFFGMRKASEKTLMYVFLFLLIYSLAVCGFHIWTLRKIGVRRLEFDEIINIDIKIMRILLIFMVLSIVPLVISSISIYTTHGMRALHEAYLHGTYNTKAVGIYKYYCRYIVQPYFLSVILLAIYELFSKTGKSTLKYQAVFCGVLYFLLTGGRKIIFNVFLFSVICFFNSRRKFKITNTRRVVFTKKNIRMMCALFLIIACAFLLLLFATSGRTYGGATIWETFCLYLFGSMSLLDIIVCFPELYGIGNTDLLYGKGTLGIITIPYSTLLSFVTGKDYQGADYLINTYAETFYRISPHSKYNAAVTILYPFFRDFGKMGILIGSVLFAFMVSFVYSRAIIGKNKLFWQIALVVVFYAIIFSFWRYAFLENTIVMIFPWLWILCIFLNNKTISFRIK